MDNPGNSTSRKQLLDPDLLSPRTTRWPPTQNQFPSRYDLLPGIGGESAYVINDDLLMLSKNPWKGSSENCDGRDMLKYDGDARMQQLEMKLAVSEKSNRALFEEVLRLQNNLRYISKHSEDVLREERKSRQQLSEVMQNSHNLISKLNLRIVDAEKRIEDKKMSLTGLFSHTQNVEKAIVHSQQEVKQWRDALSLQFQELKIESNETKNSHTYLEKVTFATSEAIRTLHSRLDNQQAEFMKNLIDVRDRTQNLEVESRAHVGTLRKQMVVHSMTNVTVTQLRGQVETRLAELRDILMDLRTKLKTGQLERRNLEKTMQAKINELQTSLIEQVRKHDEDMQKVGMVLHETDHAHQAERLQIIAKVSVTIDDVNKRLLAKGMKLREELQARYLHLKKMLQRYQLIHQDCEHSTDDEMEMKWQILRNVLEEELNLLNEMINVEQGRHRETMAKLDKSISVLEKQLVENKNQVDKLIASEIKSRKVHELESNEKIESVNEKLQIATLALQQAIGGVSQTLDIASEKLKRDVKHMLKDQQQGNSRILSDLEARLHVVNQCLSVLEDRLGTNVLSMNATLRKLADNLQFVKTVLSMKLLSEPKLRTSDLDDLQLQINQLRVLTGSSLQFYPTNQSQMDDLDVGMGCNDIGIIGNSNGTPVTSVIDNLGQQITEPTKPFSALEETKDSPIESKILKEINMQSPTHKDGSSQTDAKSPNKVEDYPVQAQESSINVTPDVCDDFPEANGIQKNDADPNNGNNSGNIQEQITPRNQSPCNLSQGNISPPIKSPNMNMSQPNMAD